MIRMIIIMFILITLFVTNAFADQWCEWVICEQEEVCKSWEHSANDDGMTFNRTCTEKKLENNCEFAVDIVDGNRFKEEIFGKALKYECWPLPWGPDYVRKKK